MNCYAGFAVAVSKAQKRNNPLSLVLLAIFRRKFWLAVQQRSWQKRSSLFKLHVELVLLAGPCI